ncbi:LysE family transporter [Niallia sp. 03133]|uniref:LysE family transporter n=1 Tax=Niallia sp. 03133 TaxID=3458060 RepID=UPI0040442D28
MGAIFSYILLGLSLAAPIGPVNAAQLNKGLRSGFFHSWLIGLGSMSADIVYMIAVYIGLAQFLEFPIIKTFLWLFGGFVLIYTGIESLVSSENHLTRTSSNKESAFHSYRTGFLMSLSNPLTIVFWLGVYGSVLANSAQKYGTAQMLLYSCSILLGLFIWDITMATLSSIFKNYLSYRMITLISKISAFSLIGFGFYFGYNGILFFL